MFNRPRIIPVLLMDDRDLIKTINFKNRTYLGDPVNAVKIFNRKGIVIVSDVKDIDALMMDALDEGAVEDVCRHVATRYLMVIKFVDIAIIDIAADFLTLRMGNRQEYAYQQ